MQSKLQTSQCNKTLKPELELAVAETCTLCASKRSEGIPYVDQHEFHRQTWTCLLARLKEIINKYLKIYIVCFAKYPHLFEWIFSSTTWDYNQVLNRPSVTRAVLQTPYFLISVTFVLILANIWLQGSPNYWSQLKDVAMVSL